MLIIKVLFYLIEKNINILFTVSNQYIAQAIYVKTKWNILKS